MSAIKNVVEGMLSLVAHLNATQYKVQPLRASLIGEFEESELVNMISAVERARWKLTMLQSEMEYVYAKAREREWQRDIFADSSPVPAALPGKPLANGENGIAGDA